MLHYLCFQKEQELDLRMRKELEEQRKAQQCDDVLLATDNDKDVPAGTKSTSSVLLYVS